MIHKSSDVQSTKIGVNTNIWQFCVILEDAEIGKNCNINANVFIENKVKIGNNVTIKSGVQLWDGITIEDNAFIGPNVTFTNDLLPRSKQYPSHFLQTCIKNNASIGGNSTIIGGIVIGENAMIGAGSLVTKDVPRNTLWYGSPARYICEVCDCGEKVLKANIKCLNCKKIKIMGRKINLQVVEVQDANFIFTLRQDKEKTKYLSCIGDSISEQIKWIEGYKEKEKVNSEYYFVIESKENESYGLVRIYDFQEDSFSWGSWLIKDEAPKFVAIESALQIYEIAFNSLGFEKSHFEVNKNNKRVIAFHQRFGAKIIDEDDTNYYFNFTKADYDKIRSKYLKYLL